MQPFACPMRPFLEGRGFASLDFACSKMGGKRGNTGVLIEARGVCKSYRYGNLSTEVLRHVGVSVSAGEMVSIVGPSGSGKSTLLHCLAGLEVPEAGEIHLMGVDIVRARRGERAKVRARHVGFVFQQYNLMPSLSVGENVSLPVRLAGSKLSRENVRELLERVGMGGREHARPAELSGGEAQRVAIARAVASGPDIVFADEPTGALDTANGNAVLDMLRAMADEGSRAVVMVTHDLEAAARADRVLVLRDGEIVHMMVHPTSWEILTAMGETRARNAAEGVVSR